MDANDVDDEIDGGACEDEHACPCSRYLSNSSSGTSVSKLAWEFASIFVCLPLLKSSFRSSSVELFDIDAPSDSNVSSSSSTYFFLGSNLKKSKISSI
jgi:hypothetical protein